MVNAHELDIPVVVMHIGGENRRDSISDQVVRDVGSWADYLIVVEDGNKDGLFTNIADEKNIPLELVPDVSTSIEPLNRLVKQAQHPAVRVQTKRTY